jgi:major intracellular serine protease
MSRYAIRSAGDPIFRLPPLRVEATFTSLSETIDWGLAAYRVPDHWKSTRGLGVRVAVLDTGIDANHPDLATAVETARDFTRSPRGFVDSQGHGTHVAGTIAARQNDVGVVGVAPQCRLLVAKVLGDDGSGTSHQVAAGVDWAVACGADILSMSLGSPDASPNIAAAIDRAVAAGRFVICAAGNDGRDDAVNYPARWESTIAVGAVDRQGSVARFSSRGPQVDVCAPGADVLSTFPAGRYARLSGTSMATPFVTGVVALMLAKHRQHGGATPVRNVADLREHLRRTATDAGPTGRDPAYGFGLVNPDALLAEAPPAPPPFPPAPDDSSGVPGVTVFIPHARVV